MELGIEGLIIVSCIAFFSFFIYSTHFTKLQTIKSDVDNRDYTVQTKEDAKEAANLIAVIRNKLIILVEHLMKAYQSDERTGRITENFNPDKLKEGVDNPEFTSYSINKGEQIVLCLRTNNKLMDINTMLFVVIHELAHIATISIGHTEEFWDNFRWLLEEAINIGIYVKQDFDKKPVEYCGMTITDSPLDK